jgi:predicted metal-dependent peptidase
MDPTCIVVFTDGYIECPSTNPTGIPTMFVLTSDGDENLSDWGTKVKFKSSN